MIVSCSKSTFWTNILGMVVCLAALAFSVRGLMVDYSSERLVFCLLIFACIVLVVFSYVSTCRKYFISEEGITTKCFVVFKKHYSWDSFVTAGVYLIDYKKEERKFFIFSKESFEKRTPTFSYLSFSPRSCLWFPYTAERYTQLKKLCPKLAVYARD